MKLRIYVLRQEILSVETLLIAFLLFAICARGNSPGVFALVGFVMLGGLILYSRFRREIPSIQRADNGSLKKIRSEIWHLNSMRFSLYSKACLALSIFMLIGSYISISLPVLLYVILVSGAFLLIFREEVPEYLFFNKRVHKMMISCEDYTKDLINRLENGKSALCVGIVGLFIYSYAIQGSNFLDIDVILSGIITLGILVYVYRAIFEADSRHCTYNGYAYRKLNYSGFATQYIDGEKYINGDDLNRYDTLTRDTIDKKRTRDCVVIPKRTANTNE